MIEVKQYIFYYSCLKNEIYAIHFTYTISGGLCGWEHE